MAEEVFSEYFGGYDRLHCDECVFVSLMLSRLFDSERFSDVTIVCEGRRLHAHKTIICTQSDFFAKACEGSFKVRLFPCAFRRQIFANIVERRDKPV